MTILILFIILLLIFLSLCKIDEILAAKVAFACLVAIICYYTIYQKFLILSMTFLIISICLFILDFFIRKSDFLDEKEKEDYDYSEANFILLVSVFFLIFS